MPARGFITVLADANLIEVAGNYEVYGQASGMVMCDVQLQVAAEALAHPQNVTLLGHWEGSFRGRSDRWGVWYCHDVPWAATSDVQTPAHAARLINEFTRAMEQADRDGRVHSPSPPSSSYPFPASSQAVRRGASTGLLGGFVDGFASVFGIRR